MKKEQLKQKSIKEVSQLWGFSNLNYLFFIFGIMLIFLGYIIMILGEVNSFQSLTLAPIFLFVGYIILIPLSLVTKSKKD